MPVLVLRPADQFGARHEPLILSNYLFFMTFRTVTVSKPFPELL